MKKPFVLALIVTATLASIFVYFVLQSNKGPTLGGDFTLSFKKEDWTLSRHKKPLSLLYIGYAKCPDVCPMALSYTSAAFSSLSEDELTKVQMIFISVDAAHDTPEAVATYAAQFHPSFIGLTGTQEQIDATIKPLGASYIVEEDKKSYLGYSISHTDRLYLLDNKGYVVDMIPSPRSADEILQKIKEHL